LSVEINIYMNEWQEAGKQAARKKNEKWASGRNVEENEPSVIPTAFLAS
jgi:hypothetical protein